MPEDEMDRFLEEDLKAYDEFWAEDIKNIEDPDLKEKELLNALNLIKEEEN